MDCVQGTSKEGQRIFQICRHKGKVLCAGTSGCTFTEGPRSALKVLSAGRREATWSEPGGGPPRWSCGWGWPEGLKENSVQLTISITPCKAWMLQPVLVWRGLSISNQRRGRGS
ncbi:mediator of RNA polymerase II transcription subunit 10 isoform 2-T4 [Alca torda]